MRRDTDTKTGNKAASKKKAAASKTKAATQRQTRGRPTMYTKAIGDAICLRLAEGESLRSVCADPEMPSLRTVLRWLSDSEHGEFWQQHARAREARAELEFDDMLAIADDCSRDTKYDAEGNPCVDHGVIQRDKLRIETRKWILARMAPKRYGNKVDHKVQDERHVSISMDTRPLESQ